MHMATTYTLVRYFYADRLTREIEDHRKKLRWERGRPRPQTPLAASMSIHRFFAASNAERYNLEMPLRRISSMLTFPYKFVFPAFFAVAFLNMLIWGRWYPGDNLASRRRRYI